MSPVLHLRLLGQFSLNGDDPPLMTIKSPRLQSLLAYLILHRQAPQARQHLAFCLWPDLPEARARANLRKQLHQLQRVLPEAVRYLIVDAQTLQWRADSSLFLDVAEFEIAASHTQSVADLQRALDLYAGDLLPSCYDDWIVPERERLKQIVIEVLEHLQQFAADEGHYAVAIKYTQRLLQIDPVREEIHRHLINLHALNQDRAAALRAYHTCASVLQRELGVEPAPATREAYERLLNLEATAVVPLEATFPLVGREREWAQLQTAWRTTCTGHSQLVILIGEAGIGKTRLADELFTRVKRQGINAAAAHCYSAEGTLAYAPVVAWLRAHPLPNLESVWLSEVVRLLPEVSVQHPDLPSPGPLTEAWQRQRLHEALARAVLGNGELLLLWIEDLQWCDRDTLEWLHYLLRFDRKARLLIVGTLRLDEVLSDHPVSALLSALRRDRQLMEIAVGPLDATYTQQLASYVAGHDLDPDRTDCLYQETEGNPLFIIETLRANSECAETDTLPPTVQAVITTRLAQLSAEARELMELAATVGREFTFEILQRAGSLDEKHLVRGLDELWQRCIVREIGTSAYDFSHGKLREVAYAGLSSAHRRLLHRRVAEALVALHANDVDSISAQAAAHYQQAGLAEQAVAYYRRAAHASQRVYANQEALTYLNRALELISPDSYTERYDLLLVRNAIYDVQGVRDAQQQDLIELHRLAQVLGDKSRQAEVCLHEARYAESVSDYDAAIKAAQLAIRLAQAANDIHREAAGYLQWGRALWQHGVIGDACAQLEQAFRLAQTAHLSDVEADSLYNLSSAAEFQGDQIRARDCAKQAVELYHEIGDRRGEFRALNVLGVATLRLGNSAQADVCFNQALRLCREIGDRRGESMVLRNLGARLADSSGDYAAAQTYFEQSCQICGLVGERRGESESLTYLAISVRHLGKPQSAYEYSWRAVHLAQQVGAKYEEGLALTHLGHALVDLGQLTQAADIYRQALAVRRELGNLNMLIEPLAGLASVALAQGDLAQAQAQVEEILSDLTAHALNEADEAELICLICYHVLCAGRDSRATYVLKMAYDFLQAQAARLSDEDARQTFLENDPLRREIVQAWNNIA
ncbi:MAG TPA: AAA family ATPase [Anaerolineae bacterium]|nr:AAA family ATPase [Anaerolineae bacterium]